MMTTEQSFVTGDAPQVVLTLARGDVVVRAGEEPRVVVRGQGEGFTFEQRDDQVVIGDGEDCEVIVPAGAQVTLGKVEGDAQISGVRGGVTVEHVSGSLRVAQTGPLTVGRVDGDTAIQGCAGAVTVGRSAGNLNIAEVQGALAVERCHGDCRVRAVQGDVVVERVNGALHAKEVAALRVVTVHGDCVVQAVEGAVQVGRVGGSLSATEVEGALVAERVGGDLRARGVAQVTAAVGGSALLRLSVAATTPEVRVTAGGDVRCRVPAALDAQVRLTAGGARRVKHLVGLDPATANLGEFTVGRGAGRVDLTAGGSIKLMGVEEDDIEIEIDVDVELQQELADRVNDVMQQVSGQVEEQMESLARQLNARISALDTGDVLAGKLQQKLQAAMRRAEARLAEAAARMEGTRVDVSSRAGTRQDRRGRTVEVIIPPIPPVPPVPPAPAKRPPVSDEERMTILRMLEQGKITVEQAEKLLAALEG